jgi:hypothetical protein
MKNKLEIINLYSKAVKDLKENNIIRSNNIVGDLGETYAVEIYSKTRNLPKLQLTPPSTKHIDAISVEGERYTVKTISGNNKVTGVFYGLADPDGNFQLSDKINARDVLFEYLIIVFLSDNYKLNKIIELNWSQFLKFKKWHSRMKAWNVSINKKLIDDSKIIYQI